MLPRSIVCHQDEHEKAVISQAPLPSCSKEQREKTQKSEHATSLGLIPNGTLYLD